MSALEERPSTAGSRGEWRAGSPDTVEPFGEPSTPKIRRLYSALLSYGLVVVGRQTGGMGGIEVIMVGRVGGSKCPEAIVNISAELGHWVLTVAFKNVTRAYGPRVWATYLDEVGLLPYDLAFDIGFIERRLLEVSQIARDVAHLNDLVGAVNQRYVLAAMQKRSGF